MEYSEAATPLTLVSCHAEAAHGAPASVCHSRSVSASRHAASAGFMIRKRDLGWNSAEVYFVFRLQHFLFEIGGFHVECESVVVGLTVAGI